MAEIFGLILISLVSFTIILIGLRWPDISRILYVALSLRVLLILIGHYIVPLPDSTKDAAGLDDIAWSYGKDGFLNALSNFNLNSRYFHSQIIGIFLFFVWKKYFNFTVIKFNYWLRNYFFSMVLCEKDMG